MYHSLAIVAFALHALQGTPTLDGVYLRRTVSTGYGGMITFVYRPFYAFSDSTLFFEPDAPPSTFDATRTRANAPARVGRIVRRTGDQWQVLQNTPTGAPRTLALQGVTRLLPATRGDSVSGTYRSTGGAGTLATGGDVAVSVANSWTFTSDGRFTQQGSAGVSSSRVTAGSTSPTRAGRYAVDNHTITLTYDTGETQRALYGTDSTRKLIVIGTTTYIRR